jgi:hypothetical protein
MKRFRNTLYTTEDFIYKDGSWQYIRSEDGTLFSGRYHTKIRPEELPEWYIYGRFYKRFGFMSAKGITDLLYVPNRRTNHFLKDDYLFIAYGGRIVQKASQSCDSVTEQYSGYNEYVNGNAILSMLKAAQVHSGYDVSDFITKLKEKKSWLKEAYPDAAEAQTEALDIDAYFSRK